MTTHVPAVIYTKGSVEAVEDVAYPIDNDA